MLKTHQLIFSTGSGPSNDVVTALKIDVVPPIPRASVRMAMAVKPGDFANIRNAYFRSFISMRDRQSHCEGLRSRDKKNVALALGGVIEGNFFAVGRPFR